MMMENTLERESIRLEFINYHQPLKKLFPEFANENASARNTFVYGLNLAWNIRDVDSRRWWLFLSQHFDNFSGKYVTFRKMLDKYPVFVCANEDYCSYGGVAKLYVATEHYAELLDLCHQMGVEVETKELVGGRLKPISKKKFRSDLTHDCTIDLNRLKSLIDLLKDSDSIDELSACQMLLLSASKNGKLTQRYKRAKCGRLFCMSKANIQNIHGFIREEVFYGYFRTDAVNCHYTLATKYTEHHAIHEYANETARVRKLISDQVGCTKTQVKKGLIALMYGASTRPRDSKDALVKIMGVDFARKFVSNFKVQKILEGINQLTTDLIEKRGRVGDMPDYKVRHHWLTKDESVMLDCAISLCDDIQGLYFDGIVSESPIDTTMLSALVFQKLGVQIQFKVDRVGHSD